MIDESASKDSRRRGSCGEGLVSSLSVFVEGDGVHAEGEAQQVDVLASVADGVGPAQPERVVEVPVDGFATSSTSTRPSSSASSRTPLLSRITHSSCRIGLT
jgi:hypothetical protein